MQGALAPAGFELITILLKGDNNMPIVAAVSVSDVFNSLGSVFDLLLEQFSTTVSTITTNPLLFVPVLLGFGGGLIMAGVNVVRKFGVRGMSGRRRRR